MLSLKTVLYCTVLDVLYCVLYCTVLYCAVLYCTELHCTGCTALHCTVLYCTVLFMLSHPTHDPSSSLISSNCFLCYFIDSNSHLFTVFIYCRAILLLEFLHVFSSSLYLVFSYLCYISLSNRLCIHAIS